MRRGTRNKISLYSELAIRVFVASILICLMDELPAQSKVHSVDIEVKVTSTGGNIGAHFSRYYETRASGSCYTKIEKRDDENNHRITSLDPWIVHDRHVVGAGTYVLDLSDRDDNPSVSVLLKIDGITRFQGIGNTGDYNDWQCTRGPGARFTAPRELAVDIAD